MYPKSSFEEIIVLEERTLYHLNQPIIPSPVAVQHCQKRVRCEIRYPGLNMSSKFVLFLNTRCSVLASDQRQFSRAISFLTSERRITDANDL